MRHFVPAVKVGWKQATQETRRLGRQALRKIEKRLLGWRDPEAYDFYQRMMLHPYDPEYFVHVLPERRLLYIAISKAANTRIKTTLSQIGGDVDDATRRVHTRQKSGLSGPRQLGASVFHRIATDPKALRFTFVRNPYDRLVSCWADKFQEKPLVAGLRFVERYLVQTREIALPLPKGADRTLSFADFVTYVTELIKNRPPRLDIHWELQSRFIDIPGIDLNFIGKVERFSEDMARVFTHANADEVLLRASAKPLNPSRRTRCAEYYTNELADRVYRAYERDFDRFGYPRAMPD